MKNTVKEVAERLCMKNEPYVYEPPSAIELEKQRSTVFEHACRFSLVVPAYETKECYLRELIESVLEQSYADFELIIVDAGQKDGVEKVVKEYTDTRIVYKKLEKNAGISENTNAALGEAKGEYTGLLDHDDVLTKDALFRMAEAIEQGKKEGKEYWMLYSDEDKCDKNGKVFYEPHRKLDFNLDLLLSNNYICHFMVIKTNVIKKLKLRSAFDGAQDYDLVLRLTAKALQIEGYEKTVTKRICHVPFVLYHWRCHEDSTAQNPKSKSYAYEAGKEAVQAFLKAMGWQAEVVHSRHLGFYELKITDVFEKMGNVGAVGGKVIDAKKRIVGGMYRNGKLCFAGNKVYFEGYMHRAGLKQTAERLDLRCIRINPKLYRIFEEITGMQYTENPKDNLFFGEKYKRSEAEWERLSEEFCKAAKAKGYRLMFEPAYICKMKG